MHYWNAELSDESSKFIHIYLKYCHNNGFSTLEVLVEDEKEESEWEEKIYVCFPQIHYSQHWFRKDKSLLSLKIEWKAETSFSTSLIT